MTNIIDVADKLRDYCSKYQHKLNIIPRTECIRIMSDIVIDPLIDITIYLRDEFSLDADNVVQYHVMDGIRDIGEMNYDELTSLLDKMIRVEEIR